MVSRNSDVEPGLYHVRVVAMLDLVGCGFYFRPSLVFLGLSLQCYMLTNHKLRTPISMLRQLHLCITIKCGTSNPLRQYSVRKLHMSPHLAQIGVFSFELAAQTEPSFHVPLYSTATKTTSSESLGQLPEEENRCNEELGDNSARRMQRITSGE